MPAERKKYVPRPLPAPDLAAYVQRSITRSPYRYDVVVRLHAPVHDVAALVGPHVATLTAEGPDRTILRAGWDRLEAPAAHLAGLDMDFEILAPAEFAHHVRRLAQRLDRAAGGGRPASDGVPASGLGSKPNSDRDPTQP
jgi:hypothetical protein